MGNRKQALNRQKLRNRIRELDAEIERLALEKEELDYKIASILR